MITYRTLSNTVKAEQWPILIPRRKTRSFCCGSTGVGKSTVGCALLEQYHFWYPKDRIVIVDTKERFVAASVETDLIFPEGPFSRNHGKVDGVAVNGQFLHRSDAIMWPKETVFVVQDAGEAYKFLGRLYKNADAREPVLIYFDESMDFIKSNWVAWPLYRILKQGREKGIGLFIISQGALGVQRDILGQAERLYIMTMYNNRDRERIVEVANVPNPQQFKEVIPIHKCDMIEQGHPKVYEFSVRT